MNLDELTERLRSDAANLEADIVPGEPNEAVYRHQVEHDRAAATAIEALRAENERLRGALTALVRAAEGLALGEDWNHGTQAKIHRPKLIAAIPPALAALQGRG